VGLIRSTNVAGGGGFMKNQKLVAGSVMGAAIALVAGYAVHVFTPGIISPSFVSWLTFPFVGRSGDALLWIVLGTVAGGAAGFLFGHQNSN
jgi:hypothetical protein